MANNISYAFVSFKLDGKELIKAPYSSNISFTHKRRSNIGGNSFTITMLDETNKDLENKILSSNRQVEYSYGFYTETGGLITSPIYRGTVFKVQVQKTFPHVELEIQGIMEVYKSFGMPLTRRYKDLTISDIVKDIAKENNWKVGRVDETQEVMVSDGKGGLKRRTFDQPNISTYEFLLELQRFAVAESTGLGGYQVVLTQEGKTTKVDFYPPSDKDKPSRVYDIFSVASVTSANVIDWRPEYNFYIVDNYRTQAVFSYDKIGQTGGTNTAKVVPLDGKKGTSKAGGNSKVEGAILNKNTNISESESQAMGEAGLANLGMETYKGELEIIGDPTLLVGAIVNVKPITYDGSLSPSAGLYNVYEIEDDIEGGTYKSILRLRKTGIFDNQEDGTVTKKKGTSKA